MNILTNLSPEQRSIVKRIANILEDNGGRAVLVGGCVRDGLLGIPIEDIDMEVYGLHANAVKSALSPNFRLNTVGRAFGVFILPDFNIDIALPRREFGSGPKHTDFIIEGDPDIGPEEAASRRDFTINAISYDPLTEEYLDPWNGIADIKAKCLRHVSGAFIEDPLRVLRGMQFIARFDLNPHPETVELCRGLTPLYLPKERLWGEWKKLILKGKPISKGLSFLKDCNWLQYFPELEALDGCEQDPQWHPEGDVWKHTLHSLDIYASKRINHEWEDLIVGLAVLCHDMGKPDTTYTDECGRIRSPRHDVLGVPVAQKFLKRLTEHKKIFQEVLPLVREHMRPMALYRDGASDSAIRRLATRVKRIDRLIRVVYADKNGRPSVDLKKTQPLSDSNPREASKDELPEGKWLLDRSTELAVQDQKPKAILLGRHLIELGLKPGPSFSQILDQAYEAQIDGIFSDESGGRAYLKNLLGRPNSTDKTL